MTRPLHRFAGALWREHRASLLLVGGASLALMLTEGVGLLMLVPMLRLVGVSLGDGTSDRIADGVDALFRGFGLVPTLVSLLAAVVVLVTARAALQWVLAVREARLEVDVVGPLRVRLFAAVVRLPWARFVGERPAALVHAIGPQVDDVHGALALLLQVASTGAAVLATAVVALLVSPPLTAVVAVVAVVLLVTVRALRAPGLAEGDRLLEANSRLFARISEMLGGLKMVHVIGAEARAVDAMESDTARWAALTGQNARRRALVAFVLGVLGVLILAVLVWASVVLVRLAPASLLLLLLLYSRLVPRISELQALGSSLAQALASYDAVETLLARCEAARGASDRAGQEAHDASLPPAVTPAPGARVRRAPVVEVRDITVRYPGTASPAIAHFSARFPAGAFTVVVGASGAGKTTVADVVLGLLTVQGGEVLVDGVSLRDMPIAEWRAHLGYLGQEPMLFHGTIRENISFARPDASDGELRAALDAAACDFVYRLPQGLDAAVGDRGVMLSGGERQRIALARALLRAPDLLVLDEATSALDADTERRVLDTVRGLSGKCTVVFCTHRDAVRRAADYVVELTDSRG